MVEFEGHNRDGFWAVAPKKVLDFLSFLARVDIDQGLGKVGRPSGVFEEKRQKISIRAEFMLDNLD
jgi:hypothetical protein